MRETAAARGLSGILIGIIRGYQRVSRLTPSVCRFHPTCSEYAAQSLEEHGPWKGIWLATKRICRCHPFHPGGYDPVPTRRERPEEVKSKP